MFTIVFSMLVPWLLSAEESISLGGYLENTTTLTLADTAFFADNAVLRVEVKGALEKSAVLEAHLIYASAIQPLDPFSALKPGSKMANTVQSTLAVTTGAVTSLLDIIGILDLNDPRTISLLRYLPYSSFYPKDRITLDRALLKLFFKKIDIYIGRQQIAWGTGYGYNPTDIWNAKSPLDPAAPKLGINAFRAEVPLGQLSSLDVVVTPGIDFDHTSSGLRLKSNLARFDFSLSGMKVMNADRELYNLPKKVMLGADMAGQIIWDIGIWSEAVFVNPVYAGMTYTEFDSAYVQVSTGMDYTFSNGLYVLGEYYFNGLGEASATDYDMTSLLNLYAGEMAGMAQHYLMLGIRKTILEVYNLTLFALVNPGDQSAVLLPGLEYPFNDALLLHLSGSVFLGDEKDSEYGSFYSNLMLKVTGYF